VGNDDRRCIERLQQRLQQLPQYRPVVDKLLRGWSPDAVTDWLMEQTDRGPLSGLNRSNVCSYLVSLNVRLKANSRESTEKVATNRAQRLTQLADEFTSGMTPKADVAAKQPEPIDEVVKLTETQHPSSMIDELTSGGLLRLILKIQMSHVDRMEEWEKQWNMPCPGWDPGMQVLISLEKILQEKEFSEKRFETQAKAGIPVPEPQPSEETQRIEKLTELDRQRIRDAGAHFKTLLKRTSKEAQSN